MVLAGLPILVVAVLLRDHYVDHGRVLGQRPPALAVNVVARILLSLQLVAKVLIIVDARVEDALPRDWVLYALAQRHRACLLKAKVDDVRGLLLLVPLVNDGEREGRVLHLDGRAAANMREPMRDISRCKLRLLLDEGSLPNVEYRAHALVRALLGQDPRHYDVLEQRPLLAGVEQVRLHEAGTHYLAA